MAFKLLDSATIRRILDVLHPRFVGRDQDHLIALADESGAAAYEAAQTYVQPLYDFRDDIQSTAGAGMVGIEDSADNFTATDVEGALAELDDTKAPLSHTHDDRYYTESETNTLLAAKAPLASPTFTGTPTAPTPITSDNSTKLATTAWVTGKGYTSSVGTVTNVSVIGSTGLTVGGSPITSSGTITLTLSANLQAWSALATSAKQDASANLTSWAAIAPSSKQDSSANLSAWSALATSSKQDSSANLNTWSGIAASSKADDSAVVHNTGDESITGVKTFAGLGSAPAGSSIQISAPAAVPGLVGQYSSTKRRDIRFTDTGIQMGASSSISAPSMTFTVDESGRITAATGSDGLVLGTHTAAGYGALWYSGITPSGTNYALATKGNITWLNSTTTLNLATNGTARIVITDTSASYGGNEIGWKSMPVTTMNSNYTFVAADKSTLYIHSSSTSHTFTVPSGVFSAGDTITVTHTAASGTLTLAQGAGASLFLVNSTGSQSNRTIAPRGVATIMFISSGTALVGGPGVT